MKIFGHPVHMMLIHFPSALLPMDLVCSAVGFYNGDSFFVHAAFYAMTGGVAFGILAIITGLMDLTGVMNDKPAAVKKVLVHGGINTLVMIGYSVLVFAAFKNYPQLMPAGLFILILKSALIILMLAGNFFGGRLILKEKIAIEK